jgi:hypothetical protein
VTDVRSQRLAAWRSTGESSASLFVVPAATVILLKSIYVGNWSVGSATPQLYVQVGNVFVVLFEEPLESTKHARWDGWVAMNPDDGLWVHTTQVDTLVWCSGAVLAGGPPYPVLPTREVPAQLPMLPGSSPKLARAE